MYASLTQNILIKQTRDYNHTFDFHSFISAIALES